MTGNILQSNFVTNLANLFILLFGGATIILAFLSFDLFIRSPFPILDGLDESSVVVQSHFIRIVFILIIWSLFCLISLVSAIGLLKRKNWSRLSFIGIFSCLIIWRIYGLIQHFSSPLLNITADNPKIMAFNQFLPIFRTLSALLSVVLIIVFIWLIKKLTAKNIKAEFLS